MLMVNAIIWEAAGGTYIKSKGKVLWFFDSLDTGIKRMVNQQQCLWQVKKKADDALLKFDFTQKIYQVDGLFWNVKGPRIF